MDNNSYDGRYPQCTFRLPRLLSIELDDFISDLKKKGEYKTRSQVVMLQLKVLLSLSNKVGVTKALSILNLLMDEEKQKILLPMLMSLVPRGQ